MNRRGAKSSRPVYSTDKGRLCPDCGVVEADCRCRLLKTAASGDGDGIVRLRRESKGRGGKVVTVVTGLPGDTAAVKALAKTLKQRCGVGGAVKDGIVELQGDHRETIKAFLQDQGHTVKLAGG